MLRTFFNWLRILRSKNLFNNRLGILKRRFHCLHTEMRLAPGRACKTVAVCMMLHNFAIRHGAVIEPEHVDKLDGPPQPPRAIENPTERARTNAGKATRDQIVHDYFR